MASWTAPVTHASGDVLAVTDWNGVASDCTFLYEAPYIRVYDSAGTSLTNNTFTQVSLGGTTTSGYGWSVSGNNIVAPLTGIYWAAWGVNTDFSASAYLLASLFLDASRYADGVWDYTSGEASSTGATLLAASATNGIGLYGYQTSGSAVTTGAYSYATYLSAAFVGSQ